MKVAYFDCFAGVSGDMALGALVDAGLDADRLIETLKGLGLEGYSLSFRKEVRGYLSGTRAEVRVQEGPAHRHLPQIEKIIQQSALERSVQEKVLAVFHRLAKAEAAVHGIPPEKVHFHEVGALDAILDIAGTVAGLSLLGVDKIYTSALPLGDGFVECQHGTLPLPAPAVVELTRGFEVRPSPSGRELTTPTGAALMTALAEAPGSLSSFILDEVGYGFGRAVEGDLPNALRLVLGRVPGDRLEEVALLETNLDTVTGEEAGYLIERCLEEGALDAFVTPIQMKKSRPGMLFSALVSLATLERIRALIHDESGTLGIRIQRLSRSVLERESTRVDTSLGSVRVKKARLPGRPTRFSPEQEDVARIAREKNLPLRRVRDQLREELRDRDD